MLADGRARGFWFLLYKWNGWGSLTFGLFLAVCLWLFSGLHSVWRTLFLILASPVAALLSFYVALFMAVQFRIGGWTLDAPGAELKSYFIGGFVGALLLSLVVPWVLERKIPLRRQIVQSLCCAISGGALAVAGILAGSPLRVLCLRLDTTNSPEETSLLLVWQAGVALLLALQLWMEENGLLQSSSKTSVAGRAR